MSDDPSPRKAPRLLRAKRRGVQYAVLPWREASEAQGGGKEVLLITSRDTGRWVIPKGWPMKGKTPWEAASIEAYEEAGVKGLVDHRSVGTYRYVKRLSRWRERPVEVEVYCLEVTREVDDWPESHQRRRAWVSPSEAASRVDEPELAEIIRALA